MIWSEAVSESLCEVGTDSRSDFRATEEVQVETGKGGLHLLGCNGEGMKQLLNWCKERGWSSSNRIVVYGETMLKAVVPGSAKSFNFQKEFKLSDEEVRLTEVEMI